MPQADFAVFPSVIFYMIVTFFGGYIFFITWCVPKIILIYRTRNFFFNEGFLLPGSKKPSLKKKFLDFSFLSFSFPYFSEPFFSNHFSFLCPYPIKKKSEEQEQDPASVTQYDSNDYYDINDDFLIEDYTDEDSHISEDFFNGSFFEPSNLEIIIWPEFFLIIIQFFLLIWVLSSVNFSLTEKKTIFSFEKDTNENNLSKENEIVFSSVNFLFLWNSNRKHTFIKAEFKLLNTLLEKILLDYPQNFTSLFQYRLRMKEIIILALKD